MNPNPPLSLGSIPNLFSHPLALLAGVLLCLARVLAPAQSVTFAGAQTTLPFSGLNYPDDVAVDTLGNVFVADYSNARVVELPKTGAGYGPQVVLPDSNLGGPVGVAVDSAEDVFVMEQLPNWNWLLFEFPWSGGGYGSPSVLPGSGFGGLYSDAGGPAVDNAGDVFAIYNSDTSFVYSVGSVNEWPWSATGYRSPTTLGYGGAYDTFNGIAADGAGDVFLAYTYYSNPGTGGYPSYNYAVELPATGAGYGQAIDLPISSFNAVDSAGDVFLLGGNNNNVVQELPRTGTAYGPLVTLGPISGFSSYPGGGAVDSQGNLFIADSGNNRVVELQTISVNFGGANVCAPGATTPAPCSQTLTLHYNVNADATLGTPEVLTGGMTHQDFVRTNDNTCTGAVTAGTTCKVQVTFAPLAAGFRYGAVNLTDGSGNFISTTHLSGFGVAATTGPPAAQLSTDYLPFGVIAFGTTKTLPLMVANIGGGTLTVTSSISGHSYKISQSTCAAGVTPGNTCTLVIEFSPTSISTTHDDILTVETNGGNPTVNLAGAAID